MIILNTAEPFNTILLLTATVLIIFLGKETKKSFALLVMLIIYLALLVYHTFLLLYVSPTLINGVDILSTTVAVDYGLISIAFFSYLLLLKLVFGLSTVTVR